jgi:hypothetical protein
MLTPVRHTTQNMLHTEIAAGDERAIKQLIELYRLGYQTADVDMLAAICADFTPTLGAALSTYHQYVKDLTVTVEDVHILRIGSEGVVAAFTRQDNFIDAQSGKRRHVQARLTKQFVQRDGVWQMLAAADIH